MNSPETTNGSNTMGSWEALWIVVGFLVLASAVGLAGPAWMLLAVAVASFAGGALYWKVRVARQRARLGR